MTGKDDQAWVNQYLYRLGQVNKAFTPLDWQRPVVDAIFRQGYKLIWVNAGRSTGKTHFSKYILNRSAYCFPKTSNYIIGPTRKQQAEIVWEQADGLPNFVDLKAMGGVARHGEYRVEFPKLGSFVKVDGSEEFYSYRGVPFHLMVLDEFQNQDVRFYKAAFPNLFKRKEAVLVIIGHPSPLGENHYDEMLEQARKDKRWFVVDATCFDNSYLDAEALLVEKQAHIDRGEYYEWMCEYEARRLRGGKRSIFPTFSKARHTRPRDVIITEIERDKTNLLYGHGIDPGSSVCFGGVLLAYDERLGKVYVLADMKITDEEQVSTGKVYPVVQEQRQKYVPEGAYYSCTYDEAARWFEREVSDQFGEGMEPSQKSKNDKDDGLSLIRDLMANDNFMVAEECVDLIDQIEKYKREENGKIKKKFDDLIDALRYALAALGVKASPSVIKVVRDRGEVPAHIRGRFLKPEKKDMDEMMGDALNDSGGFEIW